ncbi:MAG: DUF3891 family protein [Chloroflexota bacterium]|nr:DUF3891 family protein [Chloroflexota bacterium]
MLHRAHPEGMVVIGQPAHARLVGSVGRAWGRPPFGMPPHPDETLLAAEQHEVGMLPWEIAPTFNPATGLPHAYLELSRADHLALWRDAGSLMLTQSRYAALLVSRHGVWIFSQYDRPPDDPAERAAVAAYLHRERAFQSRIRASLAAEPAYREAVRPPTLRQSHFVFTIWDRIAVHACYGMPVPEWGVPAVYRWDRVPISGGTMPLTLSFVAPDRWTLDPWPITVDELRLVGEGRLLRNHYGNETEMREALEIAPWVRWESVIAPVQ